MRSALIALLLAAAGAARAGTLAGQIDDPALRRKVQLVYVETAPGQFPAPATPAVMNQQGNKYVPRLLPVMAGQVIEFRSGDPELHNVYARGNKKTLFNQAVLPHKVYEKKIDEPGVVHLSCNIHKEMSADIVVLQNPYFATPDKKGHFSIPDVPAGTYKLRIFGEGLSEEQRARTFEVTVGNDTPPLKLAMR
jgi:plastocyanin